MGKTTSISIYYVNAALAGARAKGFDSDSLLKAAGISSELLSKPKVRVSAEQYTKLFRKIELVMGDEYIGLAAQGSPLGCFSMACLLMINCNNLQTALSRGSQFYSLFDAIPFVELIQQSGRFWLVFRSKKGTLENNHFLEECLLLFWHRLSCWLVGERIMLLSAEFRYPEPRHSSEYKNFFFCPHKFNQSETRLEISPEFLKIAPIRNEKALRNFLRLHPYELLNNQYYENSFSSKIRAVLKREGVNAFPNFETLAAELMTSPQTLHRRLRGEKSSYQKIKDELRRDEAIYHISRNRHSISKISALIGFSEPSTFHRAFKKWTGVTPGAYRHK